MYQVKGFNGHIAHFNSYEEAMVGAQGWLRQFMEDGDYFRSPLFDRGVRLVEVVDREDVPTYYHAVIYMPL